MAETQRILETILSLAATQKGDQAISFALKAAHEHRHSHDLQNEIGVTLFHLGAFDASAACFRTAIMLAPARADYFTNLGLALTAAKRLGEAEAILREAIRLSPTVLATRLHLADLLVERRRPGEAEALYRRVVADQPDLVSACQKLGNLLLAGGRIGEIVELVERLVEAAPQSAAAHQQLSVAYELAGRLEEALTATRTALALQPPKSLDMTMAAYASLVAATGRIGERAAVKALLVQLASEPFETATPDLAALRRLAFLMPYYGVEDPLRLRVLNVLGNHVQARATAIAPTPKSPSGRLRVGYMTHNFGNHPLGHLLAPFFEAHDHGQAELLFYSLNRRLSDRSGYPERLKRSADRVLELEGLSDHDAASAIRASEPHILIDLDGYLGGGRPEILARRPAPIQIHWLQHLAGMPAPFIDYTVVDPILTPDSEVTALNGPLIRLPYAFQCGDRVPLPAQLGERAAVGLPDAGIVFCAFGNWLKIDAKTLASWSKILAATPGAVLWLNAGASGADTARLVAEAKHFGIAADRLIFAPRIADKAAHLARHQLADLFLDTLGFSAATTAVDALWAGLPVITRRASAAHGRLSESQLRALGLSELIAADTDGYVALAIDLARDPPRLHQLKAKLRGLAPTAPLFDSDRLAAYFAAIYRFAWARRGVGAPPSSFDVTADARCIARSA